MIYIYINISRQLSWDWPKTVKKQKQNNTNKKTSKVNFQPRPLKQTEVLRKKTVTVSSDGPLSRSGEVATRRLAANTFLKYGESYLSYDFDFNAHESTGYLGISKEPST